MLNSSWPGKMIMPFGSTSSDVQRGLLKSKLQTGNANIMFIGDSITTPYNTSRVAAACVKRWPVNTYGAMSGFVANGDTGWPISNFPPSPSGTITTELGPAGSGLRPGDQFSDTSTGHNLLRTIPHQFLADYTNQGTLTQGVFYPNNAYNVDWDSGQNLTVKLLFRSSASGCTNNRLWGRARGAGSQTDAGNTSYNTTTSPDTYRVATHSFNRGTGSTATHYCQTRTFTETELSGWRFYNLAMSVQLTTPPSSGGVFWGCAGEGGYTTRSHVASGDSLNVGGFGTYTTYYSDSALDAHLQNFGFNTFFIYLGQNQSANENPGGGTTGSYRTNIENIISRYKAACGRVGIANPTFILVSLYPTQDDNTRTINIANDLRGIALADTAVEYIDLRTYVVSTFGNYSTWQATYAPDGIHPSQTFCNIIADYVWSRL